MGLPGFKALLQRTVHMSLFKGGFKGRGPPFPYFLQLIVFCNHFEEVQTSKLSEVELIINNAFLIYVYSIL